MYLMVEFLIACCSLYPLGHSLHLGAALFAELGSTVKIEDMTGTLREVTI